MTCSRSVSSLTVGLGCLGLLIGAAVLSGCGGGSGSDGVRIKGLPLELSTGSHSPDPMPSKTDFGGEPEIHGIEVVSTGDMTFDLGLNVETDYPISKIHLDINGEHYIVDVPNQMEEGDFDACEWVAKMQGIQCTEACVDACACVDCDDSTIENAIEQSCSVSCSQTDAQGQIHPGHELYTSEVVFADIVYHGSHGVSGILNTYSGCWGDKCREDAAKEKVVYFGFVAQDWSFLDDMEVNAIVVESQPPADKPSLKSDSFSSGTLNTEIKCGCIGPC